ncbi:MAG: polysulfide reductase NrfD [Burkholderiaceae bacterium]|nr:polysulfide reductase NrfD [Burkholderiaceae bacterium]
MARDFNAEMRCQSEWGWLLAIWLFLSGTASGLFLMYRLADLPEFFGMTAVGMLCVGGAVLLLEQGSPMRSWRAVSGIRTSWLSRGTVFVIGLLAFATLSLAAKRLPAAPWTGELAGSFGWLAALCALLVMLYPGFFLANHRSVPFWRTPMLPIVFVISAIVGASAVVLIASGAANDGRGAYRTFAGGSIAATLVVLCVYLVAMSQLKGAAGESVRLLNRAPLAWFFWGGVVVLGSALPLALLWSQPAAPRVAGVCMLGGCLLLRYCVLEAGVLVPAPLAAAPFDFIRLTRTNIEDLAREYGQASAETSRNER